MSTATFRPETFGLSSDLGMVGEGPKARRARVRSSESSRRRILEAKALLEAAWAGDPVARIRLNEAITTSDLFKSATGEVLDREMLAQYETQPTQWTKFAARTLVNNFKPKKLVDLIGSTTSLPKVPEHTNFPIATGDTAEREIKVGKFGEQYGYTLEARINDDIGELQVIPGGWANKARYTEDDTALATLANVTTGAPNTAFFNAGNGNIGTGALTSDRLQAAYTTVSTKRDAAGRLLNPGPLQLVVGPALQFTAERILNAQELRVTTGSSQTVEPNPLRGKFELVVMANLPGTAWFVMPAPFAPRPAFYVAFLRGYETPDLRQKADQGNRTGGGAIGADEGSFDDDTIWFRVRHICGAATGDPKFTYASDGIGA